MLQSQTNEYKFSNLYIGTIEIINTGQLDFQEFSFGINLTEGNKFIQNKSSSKDRHHIVEITNEPTLANQTHSFDIKLKPFNRKDRYVFDVILTSSFIDIYDDCFEISTPMPVKLTKISTKDILLSLNRNMVKFLFPGFGISDLTIIRSKRLRLKHLDIFKNEVNKETVA